MFDRTPEGRYRLRTTMFFLGYGSVNVAAMLGAFDDIARPGAWLLALAVAAPVAGQMWAALELMRQSDEYVRALMAKRFIIAAGLAMSLFSAWGFAESYAHAAHLEGWLIYPLFWACYGFASCTVKTSRV
ncbi:hypothetical protein ACO2Q0_09600 [Phenylobacterium sp. VNQ135]|uniref:hypothetical protein n=1 Tax=Phenylobacterium sp. VNQ135 TaxID=3400922 RepID=UPI003C0B83AA